MKALPVFSAPSSGGSLRQDESSDAMDQALLNTSYWDSDVDEMATILAADSSREASSDSVSSSQKLPEDDLEAVLADLLG